MTARFLYQKPGWIRAMHLLNKDETIDAVAKPDKRFKDLCRWSAVKFLLFVVKSFCKGSTLHCLLTQHWYVQRKWPLATWWQKHVTNLCPITRGWQYVTLIGQRRSVKTFLFVVYSHSILWPVQHADSIQLIAYNWDIVMLTSHCFHSIYKITFTKFAWLCSHYYPVIL